MSSSTAASIESYGRPEKRVFELNCMAKVVALSVPVSLNLLQALTKYSFRYRALSTKLCHSSSYHRSSLQMK